MDDSTINLTEWLRVVDQHMKNGEFFRAYDCTEQALVNYPKDSRLKYRAVLSLAYSGSVSSARRKFADLELTDSVDPEIEALNGLLLEHESFSAPDTERIVLLRAASSAYERAFRVASARRSGKSYLLAINCAILSLATGDDWRARELAKATIDLLDSQPDGTDVHGASDPFQALVARLAAELINQNLDEAEHILRKVGELEDIRLDLLAAARHQIEFIAAKGRLDQSWAAAFNAPSVVHYVGHIIAPEGSSGRFNAEEEEYVAQMIKAVLDRHPVAVAFGSLAAGADILFAEALLQRNAELNVVLPIRVEGFVDMSVRPAGERWVQRFEHCLSMAAVVRNATDDLHLGDDHLFAYGGQFAMGLATLRARQIRAPLQQLAVWDGDPRSGIGGTVDEMTMWRRATGLDPLVVRCGTGGTGDLADYRRPPFPKRGRLTRAMLFGDFRGFSKLQDQQIPPFVNTVVKMVGTVLESYEVELRLANTWGDGIFLVFDDAGQAALCALDIQDAVGSLDLPALGLPTELKLRLGGHLGPIYEIADAVLKRPNFFGAHVSRAARIEPITTPGSVFVTETFAAILALHNSHQVHCDYVGWMDMAKGYGRSRMFLLRRGSDRSTRSNFALSGASSLSC